MSCGKDAVFIFYKQCLKKRHGALELKTARTNGK